jgi:(2Fe-2S) ferredoxin
MRLGAEGVTQAIRAQITTHRADERIHTTRTRCNGRCADGCVVIVYPEGIWYGGVTSEHAAKLVQEHLLEGEPLQDLSIYTYDNTMKASGYSCVGERKLKS